MCSVCGETRGIQFGVLPPPAARFTKGFAKEGTSAEGRFVSSPSEGMEPSDCQSCNEVSDASIHSDDSSDAYVAVGARKGPQQRSSPKKVKSSGVYTADVLKKEQEGPSRMKVDIDKAIDLMRFSFREGMTFLDNGSGRSFEERMLVDMSDYMVNLLFEGAVKQRDAPSRMRVITPTLDKDIAHAFAKEVRKGIASELQGDPFGIIVDVRSPPSTWKHYLVLFARYLNGKGEVVERLLGIVPEPDVHGSALKVAVELMLSEAGLNLSNIRGQGYGLIGYGDEIFAELKTLVTKASPSAYWVHPYAFQLHSTLASASQNMLETLQLFQAIDALSKLIQESPRFNEKVRSLIQERRLNLDGNLEKPGETPWGSYYEALVKFAAYLPAVCDALDIMERDALRTDEKYMVFKAQRAFTEDLPFVLLLMREALGATSKLSLALDRNDLDAENFMILLQESKRQLMVLRDEGWPSFLEKVDLLCAEIDMPMPDMAAEYQHRRWSDEESATSTNLEHYHIHVFVKVINNQIRELDKRFGKESTELVCLASCLNPRNLFQAFDKGKLIKFAQFYPSEFPNTATTALDLQLQAFIIDVRSDARFHGMSALSDLSVKMVETGKNTLYPLVYLLLKLALILPGTVATAKTSSSTMKFIDSTMVKEPCNQWTSDCLLLYLERDIFESITNDDVLAYL
ncbi:hypothetical protein U9M48_007442 [Paspalum notatum var. saurae]|uniref:DUF4371 domain-containing protein n=1 Tax=Paspalum notatum var. saurae TaxID=547442 RepID=A0AAQ3PWQ7_PASNO